MTKACKRSMELAKDFDWWVDERLSKPPLDMKSRSIGLSQYVAYGSDVRAADQDKVGLCILDD